jgi:hypothetical protein
LARPDLERHPPHLGGRRGRAAGIQRARKGRQHLGKLDVHVPAADVVAVHEHREHSRGGGAFLLVWGIGLGAFGGALAAVSDRSAAETVGGCSIGAVGLAGIVAGVYALVAPDTDTRLFPPR